MLASKMPSHMEQLPFQSFSEQDPKVEKEKQGKERDWSSMRKEMNVRKALFEVSKLSTISEMGSEN